MPIWSLLCAISSGFRWPSGYPSRRSEQQKKTKEDGDEILRYFHGNQKIRSLPNFVFLEEVVYSFFGGHPLKYGAKYRGLPCFTVRRKIPVPKPWKVLGFLEIMIMNGAVFSLSFINFSSETQILTGSDL